MASWHALKQGKAMTLGAARAQIRLLVVDDHPLLRDGIAAFVAVQTDMTIVGEAESGPQSVELFRKLRPDVTLMDLQMPGGNGIDAIRLIRDEFPTARIIVLTTYAGDVQAVRALKAGAVGYLLKSSLRTELLDTVRAVHGGLRRVQSELANEIAIHAGDEPLNERELSILALVAKGRANKEVARNLAISEDTVKAYMRTIFRKLDAVDRTQAVTIALRRGVIEI
jgi:DNA-binding NarL/FixJ family response regulator